MRKVYLLPLLLMIVFATSWQACKKTKDEKAVTIVNRLDREVTFDLYSNAEDYAKGNNAIKREVIGANQNLTIAGNTFEEDKTYYMDWYTEEYYHNNWYNDNYPMGGSGNRVRIKPVVGDNTYFLEPAYKGQGRKSFLGGAGTQSSWISVGAYLYSDGLGYIDQWTNITANERYRHVVVNKNFTAKYTHKDAAGTIVEDDLEFIVHQSEVPYIELKAADGGAGNIVGGRLPVAAPPNYESSSIDTLMALFPDNEYYFMMVKL